MLKNRKLSAQIWAVSGAKPVKFDIKDSLFNYIKFHLNAFKVSLSNITQMPLGSFLTALAIGIGLCMPAFLFLGVKNLRALSPDWSAHINMTVMLSPKVTLSQAEAFQKELLSQNIALKVALHTKDVALKEFETLSGFDNLHELLQENPLPHILLLQFDSDIPIEKLNDVKTELRKNPYVEQLIFERDWIEKLQAIIRLGESLFDSLALLIGLGVTFMIGTLIRLSLERHREEVEVLHLLGATKQFIRRPFLYRGMLMGMLGGIVALLILTTLMFGIEARANHTINVFQGIFALKKMSFSDTLTLLGASGLLGWLGAWLAFSHHQYDINPT